MRTFATIIATVAALFLTGIVYMYSGRFNVAADSRDNPVVDWVLSTTRERSIDSRAGRITLPGSISGTAAENGFKHYHELCEKCHGGPGLEPTALRRGLNPKPPDLHKAAPNLTPAIAYWIVKHGIKMTAMPAFGRTYSDKELLPVVSFVNRLPNISADEYRSLARKQGAAGR